MQQSVTMRYLTGYPKATSWTNIFLDANRNKMKRYQKLKIKARGQTRSRSSALGGGAEVPCIQAALYQNQPGRLYTAAPSGDGSE